MQIPVSQAKGQLLELVRRAEAGEEIELTRRGQPVVALVRTAPQRRSAEEKRRLIDEIIASARANRTPGPDAAHAADFLYDDETGLPK